MDNELKDFRMPQPSWDLFYRRIWDMIRADRLTDPAPDEWRLTTPSEVLARRAEIEDIGRTWGAP